MLSRVANSIYWLGRYAERAENYARFIDVNFNLMLDLPPDLKEQWGPLIHATGDRDIYTEKYGFDFDRKTVIFFLSFDEDNPNSIIASVSKARENARTIRENLSKETWEQLNETYHYVKAGKEKNIWKKEDPREFFRKVKNRILLLYGLADNTMARTEGWYFRQLGQFLERADKTSRILDVKYHILLPSPKEVGSPLDFLHWTALLKSVTAFNTYRRFYGNIHPSGVVEFLVLDKLFPRSVFYCLKEAENCLYKISGSDGQGFRNSAEKAIGQLKSKLEYDDVNDVISGGLHEYLDELQVKINKISNAVDAHYFQVKTNTINQKQEQS
jgi:uncharacterized alpha-E superfamily protein